MMLTFWADVAAVAGECLGYDYQHCMFPVHQARWAATTPAFGTGSKHIRSGEVRAIGGFEHRP